jgi:hypothetical protein
VDDDQHRLVDVPVLALIGNTGFIPGANAAGMVELLRRGHLAVLAALTRTDMTCSALVAPRVIDAFLAAA